MVSRPNGRRQNDDGPVTFSQVRIVRQGVSVSVSELMAQAQVYRAVLAQVGQPIYRNKFIFVGGQDIPETFSNCRSVAEIPMKYDMAEAVRFELAEVGR